MSPRPNKPRSVGGEDRMRTTILDWLHDNERTEGWLARKVTERGYPISASSLWKTLHADRAIYVEEAVHISAITGIRLRELVV